MKLACKNKGKATRLDRLAAEANSTANRSPPTATFRGEAAVHHSACLSLRAERSNLVAAIQAMFLLYGALGLASFLIFRGLSPQPPARQYRAIC
jgi:hypothetical protein